MGELSNIMSTADVRVISAEGLNLKIVRDDTRDEAGCASIACTPCPPVHHWFAGTLDGLPTTHPVTVRLLMQGNDMPGNPATVSKWIGLYPFMTYADPAAYASYEWFTRGALGRWVTGDLCKRGVDRFAGTGPVPVQSTVPQQMAGQFLTRSGQFWTPWRRITDITLVPEENIFVFRHQFDMPTATIAMHLPYTYTYQQQVLQRLRAARFPGVFVDEIGITHEGRLLQVIRVEDPTCPTPLCLDAIQRDAAVLRAPWIDEPLDGRLKDHRVIVINAREHGTEHTSSWPLLGMLKALTADTPDARNCARRPPGCSPPCLTPTAPRGRASTCSPIAFIITIMPPHLPMRLLRRCSRISAICVPLSIAVAPSRWSPRSIPLSATRDDP